MGLLVYTPLRALNILSSLWVKQKVSHNLFLVLISKKAEHKIRNTPHYSGTSAQQFAEDSYTKK